MAGTCGAEWPPGHLWQSRLKQERPEKLEFVGLTWRVSLDSNSFPLVGNNLHFRFRGASRLLGTEPALNEIREHSRKHRAVECFHPRGGRDSRRAEIRGPMQSILQMAVLV